MKYYVSMLVLYISFVCAQDYVHESSYPYISGDTIRAIADHFFDDTGLSFNPANVSPGDIIFVKGTHIKKFFSRVAPRIKNPYILITHNADVAVPGPFIRHIKDNKIIAWFGQNPSQQSCDKFYPLPIGLANAAWPHGKIKTVSRVSSQTKTMKKKHLLVLNFEIATYRHERQMVYDLFVDKPFCYVALGKSHEEYLKTMAHSKYVLSPRGNGLDCHRTWEAMLVGCIPILINSPLNQLLADLPVLLINDWHDITEEFLHAMYPIITAKRYALEKLYADYWLNMIRKVKKDYLAGQK